MKNFNIVRIADKSDNPGLIALTILSPMQGVISLCIDRQPDFFSLLDYRGQHQVFILEKNSSIIGSFSVSRQKVFLDAQEAIIFYLGDFKVHPDFRGSTAAIRLVNAMMKYLHSQSADLLFCTAADGNNLVLPFFEGRLGTPAWQDLGRFKVFQILPSKDQPDKNFDIRNQVPEGFSLKNYYQGYFLEHYTLAPLIQEDELEKTLNLMLCQGGSVVAAISLIDTSLMKQNVVVNMPSWLKAIVWLSKRMNKAVGWQSLPGVGEPIRMLNIRYWAYAQGHEYALHALVQRARIIAASEAFHFLSVGVQEKDPVLAVFTAFRHIQFKSRGFVASLKNHQKLLKSIRKGPVFEDFSMV